MKKLILILIICLPVLVAGQTWIKVPSTNKNYWYPYLTKHTCTPFICNSGGTITDTITTNSGMRSYVAAHGGGSGTDATAQTRIDSIVEALNDTVQLQTGISQLVYIIPPSATGTQISALVNPTEGALIWNTTDKHFYYFDGTNWQTLEKVAP